MHHRMKRASRPPAPVHRIRIAVLVACVLPLTMAGAGNAARRPGSTDPSKTGPSGPESQVPNTDPVARGKYLTGAGGCMACHIAPGGDPSGASRHDGGSQAWYTPNPATGPRESFGSYSVDQLAGFLKTGQTPGSGAVAGSTAQSVHDSLHHMNEADLHAIAAYLKSIAP